MIIVRFTSGLGNQMYQYSFYELMKETYGANNVKADATWFNANNDHHGYELERIFGDVDKSLFNVEYATFSETFKATGIIPNVCGNPKDKTALVAGANKKGKIFERVRRYPNRIIREFTETRRAPYILDQLDGDISNIDRICDDGTRVNDFYDKVMNLDSSKDWYIKGFFIEQSYYKDRLDFLQNALIFPEISGDVMIPSQSNDRLIDYKNKIIGTNSVSIHVRRGDYLSDLYKDMFVSLGREYYENAVKYIRERLDNPVFYIFSDDKDFVEKEFDWLNEKVIVTGNEGSSSYRDMQLMSLCKANIIANSTFSQWGSLLNKNEHITIYPRAYLKDQDNEVKDIKGWVML